MSNEATQSKGTGKKISKKEQARRKKRKQLRLILVVELIICLVLGISYATWYIDSKMDKVNWNKIEKEKIEVNVVNNEEMKEYTNIALFGLDARDITSDKGNRSDCIIIASINNKTKEVKLISVYRDTLLEIADGYNDTSKVTHAYSYGGPQAAINTLNRNLDLDITEYATVNFASLTNAIDALGGVVVNVDEQERQELNVYITETAAINGTGYNYLYETGDVLLDGLQATTYCRIRSTAGGDIARTERQREVLSAMVTKAKNSDLSTLNDMIDTILPQISTNISKKEILTLTTGLLSYELGETQGFPSNYELSSLPSKGSIIVPADLDLNVRNLHEFLFGVTDYVPSDKVLELSNNIIRETGIYAPATEAPVENAGSGVVSQGEEPAAQ